MEVAPPPLIATPSFILRRWSVDDAPLFRAAIEASEAHLRKWTPWVVDGRVPGLTLEERLARHAQTFDAGTEWVWGIFSRDGREVLGGCGLYPRIGPGAVEIGYWLAVNHTGRGIATLAAAELARVAFASPDIDRIEIRCAPGNVASMRVPERLGYSIVDPVQIEHDRLAWSTVTVWELRNMSSSRA